MSNLFKGFSKLTKKEKLKAVASHFDNAEEFINEFESFYHEDANIQKKIDEFSENTITNFILPYGVIPGVMINGKTYTVPMVTEESSVIAAAAKASKFWAERGGYHAEVIDMVKLGHVHFIYRGDRDKLKNNFSDLKNYLIQNTEHLTSNMKNRGGGILDIELIDFTETESNFYQLKCSFDTRDSMGANFINSCLEEFASLLKSWAEKQIFFTEQEKKIEIIMSILSNLTPECLVKVWVECDIKDLDDPANGMSPQEFAIKFYRAIRIACIDPYRATTHNKGIYNGIDSVVIATGNDFRAVEACGHAYASMTGQYKSLTDVNIEDGKFKFTLTVPMALGVVGGLTNLHPVVKRSMEMLGNPSAKELMMIAATAGLANNFGAVRSLTTVGIQKGHMKMHLFNIMNHFNASDQEKEEALKYFENEKVSFTSVREFIENIRLVKH